MLKTRGEGVTTTYAKVDKMRIVSGSNQGFWKIINIFQVKKEYSVLKIAAGYLCPPYNGELTIL